MINSYQNTDREKATTLHPTQFSKNNHGKPSRMGKTTYYINKSVKCDARQTSRPLVGLRDDASEGGARLLVEVGPLVLASVGDVNPMG